MYGGLRIFPEDWDDTEWLNTCGLEGEFIHDSYEGFSEEYRLWEYRGGKGRIFRNLR